MSKPKPSVEKSRATISMTPRAWAVLHETVTRLKTDKSAYLESLVMRADNVLYDQIIALLLQQYWFNERKISEIRKILEQLEDSHRIYRETLIRIGVNASKIDGQSVDTHE